MEEEYLNDIEEPPPEGFYIYGMFLDGARWNREDRCIDD
jgi:dynein heavy chain